MSGGDLDEMIDFQNVKTNDILIFSNGIYGGDLDENSKNNILNHATFDISNGF